MWRPSSSCISSRTLKPVFTPGPATMCWPSRAIAMRTKPLQPFNSHQLQAFMHTRGYRFHSEHVYAPKLHPKLADQWGHPVPCGQQQSPQKKGPHLRPGRRFQKLLHHHPGRPQVAGRRTRLQRLGFPFPWHSACQCRSQTSQIDIAGQGVPPRVRRAHERGLRWCVAHGVAASQLPYRWRWPPLGSGSSPTISTPKHEADRTQPPIARLLHSEKPESRVGPRSWIRTRTHQLDFFDEAFVESYVASTSSRPAMPALAQALVEDLG